MIKEICVVTGGAGFIGSNLVAALSALGRLVVVIDDFNDPLKWDNIRHPNIHDVLSWTDTFSWLDRHAGQISDVFHLGAISSTTVRDINALLKHNVHFTNAIWDWCATHGKPLLYASSAATYGDGAHGFSDEMSLETLKTLAPLNPYGWSKHIVDLRILRSVAAGAKAPPAWYGVKFFNIYGPHEHHKGDMRSVALKLYQTVKVGGRIELFKSHRPDYADGMQLRDFMYVEDAANIALWLMKQRPANGLYNIGTGRAEAFLEIAKAVIAGTGATSTVHFIDMPDVIRDRYQYFTQADMRKLRSAGYNGVFRTVAEGVGEYVRVLTSFGRPNPSQPPARQTEEFMRASLPAPPSLF